jgi:hypothetical protein
MGGGLGRITDYFSGGVAFVGFNDAYALEWSLW